MPLSKIFLGARHERGGYLSIPRDSHMIGLEADVADDDSSMIVSQNNTRP